MIYILSLYALGFLAYFSVDVYCTFAHNKPDYATDVLYYPVKSSRWVSLLFFALFDLLWPYWFVQSIIEYRWTKKYGR